MPHRSTIQFATYAVLALTSFSSPLLAQAPGESGKRPNVVLIVVDTLRRDHLSCYGYQYEVSPHIDALAAEGLRFDNAWSQAPWTTPSIGALMTSRYPSALGITDEKTTVRREETMLAELLSEAGYATAAVVSHRFVSKQWNFDQGFDVFDDSNVKGHAATTSPAVTERALELLSETGEEPFFLWLHYFDPHFSYVEQPAFARPKAEGYKGLVKSDMPFKKLSAKTTRLRRGDVFELLRLYDSEIALTDDSIGRVFSALRERGLWDDTLIVLTADHGEEFLDHGKLGHAKTVFSELVHIPLIVKLPSATATAEGKPPRVVHDTVGAIDVFPTVLELAGVAPPAGIAGVSLLSDKPAERVIFSETARHTRVWGLITAGRKVIRERRGKGLLAYDLAADPRELADLSLSDSEAFDELIDRLDAFVAAGKEASVEGHRVELGKEEIEELEALGYGGSDED